MSSSNFNNCNASNHNSNLSDDDYNNIHSGNNCNKNKDNNKEQNSVSPNKHKINTNSRVKQS